MPFLDELAQRIVSEGAGVLGKNIFLSTKANLPTNGDPFVVLVEYGGMTSRRRRNARGIQRPSAQAMTHAATYPSARAFAQGCFEALGGEDGLFEILLPDGHGVSTLYHSLIPAQQLGDRGLDDLNRAQVGFNLDAEKEFS